jgi:hypothetical protein
MYCNYIIWRVFCTVVVLTGFVINVWVSVCVGFVMCGCFGNMCICIYRVSVVSFMYIYCCFVCTSVRTAATE